MGTLPWEMLLSATIQWRMNGVTLTGVLATVSPMIIIFLGDNRWRVGAPRRDIAQREVLQPEHDRRTRLRCKSCQLKRAPLESQSAGSIDHACLRRVPEWELCG